MNPHKPSPRARVSTPTEIALRANIDIPPLLLPDPASLFAERALRLRQLAAGHTMRDYLMLMAVLCEAQHTRAQTYPDLPLPTAGQMAKAKQDGTRLLSATDWSRDLVWRDELRTLLQDVLDKLPDDSPARAGIETTIALPDTTLEHQAERLLAGITLGLDMATAPLIATGLQLYWSKLAAATHVADEEAFDTSNTKAPRCPCCGSLPVASVTRVRGKLDGQRYLSCSLCSTQWNVPRITCTHCEADKDIHYQGLQPTDDDKPLQHRPAIEAETCETCRHYLKIMHMNREAHVEPVADDLATLTLDLLVSEAGFTRHGTNLLLLFGDSEVEPGPV